jgi:hypothetical protein
MRKLGREVKLMASTIENLKIELLTQALYKNGHGDEVERVNELIVEYIAKGKLTLDKSSD